MLATEVEIVVDSTVKRIKEVKTLSPHLVFTLLHSTFIVFAIMLRNFRFPMPIL